MKKMIFPIILFAIAMQTACQDADLQRVSKDMLIVSKAIAEVQNDAIEANRLGLINNDTTDKILNICLRANTAGQSVDTFLRGLSKLDTASRSSLVQLLTPISQALDPSSVVFISGITDDATKQKIEAGILLARSTISSIQIILAVGGQ
jgi:hypothetical protein